MESQQTNIQQRQRTIKTKALWIACVNGEIIYKRASDKDELIRLIMRDYMRKFGKCNITDYKRV